MGVSYEILGDLVVFTVKERVTDDDFRRAVEAVVADSRFQPGSKVLTFDLDAGYQPSEVDPREAAATLHSFMPHFSRRMAVVVGQEASIGLGQMIEKYCEAYDIEFRAFRDPNEAKEWLFQERGGF
jgi:hypothetical protein